MKKYIFIFRRDLRIVDNTGLNWLANKNIEIYPIFIYNPEQIDKTKNKYFSDRNVQFLSECLMDLDKNIRLFNKKGLNFYYGDTLSVIEDLIRNNDIDGIVLNEDYTPYSIKRDKSIKDVCQKFKKDYTQFFDSPLYYFYDIKTKGGSAYKRFKWFYESTKEMSVSKPIDLRTKMKFINGGLKSKYESSLKFINSRFSHSNKAFVLGGRKNALNVLSKNLPNLKNYKAVRQIPLMKKNTSTYLSAYNKYGCISIRELYYKVKELFGDEHELIRQIVWRDFYYNLIYYYPESFNGEHSYVNNINWSKNKEHFKKWCDGKTGFPFIDAGMRQLNSEGYMPNRLRLACANFLIKNLHIHWREGEKYFATRLIDYDPAQNNGNWQWVSSTGFESQAYYRFINPDTDLLKFDPECLYVKKYIDELKKYKCEDIHSKTEIYLPKIVDVKDSIKLFKNMVSEAKAKHNQ